MTSPRRNPRVLLAVLAAVLAALVVSACGGSSNSNGSTASSKNAAATSTTSTTTTTGSSARTAFAACLKSHGVKVSANGFGRGRGFPGGGTGTVPSGSGTPSTSGSGAPSGAPNGAGPGAGGGFPGGGFAGGNSKFAKAFQACRSKLGNSGFGGGFGARPGGAGGAGGTGNFRPHFTTALLKSYVACIRKNGYAAMPEPKASSGGSFFPASVERNAKFQAANKKCQSILFKSIRRPAAGAGTSGGTITVGGSSTTSSA